METLTDRVGPDWGLSNHCWGDGSRRLGGASTEMTLDGGGPGFVFVLCTGDRWTYIGDCDFRWGGLGPCSDTMLVTTGVGL